MRKINIEELKTMVGKEVFVKPNKDTKYKEENSLVIGIDIFDEVLVGNKEDRYYWRFPSDFDICEIYEKE